MNNLPAGVTFTESDALALIDRLPAPSTTSINRTNATRYIEAKLPILCDYGVLVVAHTIAKLAAMGLAPEPEETTT